MRSVFFLNVVILFFGTAWAQDNCPEIHPIPPQPATTFHLAETPLRPQIIPQRGSVSADQARAMRDMDEPPQQTGFPAGDVSVTWDGHSEDPNGRCMTLQQSYSYVDRYGAKWEAWAQMRTDGATIPQAVWSIVGGPFEGLYRNAAVVHDAACKRQNRTWEDSARMFHEAMRANGVGVIRAYVMYVAVYMFGPHWKTVQEVQVGTGAEKSQVEQQLKRAFSLSTSLVSISPSATGEHGGSQTYAVTISPPDEAYVPDDFTAVRDAIEQQAGVNANRINLEWIKEQITETVHARLEAETKVRIQAEAARR